MSKILKPCPLCGGIAKIIQTVNSYPNWIIQCSECYMSTISCPSAKGLVEFWNTRANEKHGKWENPKAKFPYYNWRCSVCGCEDYTQTDLNGKYKEMNYCPNCGAKMEEEKMTNYEKIKNLTLEEMIEFVHCEGACNYCIYADDDDCKGLKCREGIREWLNQEAEDND